MQNLLLIFVGLFAGPVFAASVTFTSGMTEKSELRILPEQLIGILVDDGLLLTDEGNGIFKVGLSDLKCDMMNRHALDPAYPAMGIKSAECFRNKKKLSDARLLIYILSEVEKATNNAVYFTDCAPGKCVFEARSISCTVDTKIELFRDGRLTCELRDAR